MINEYLHNSWVLLQAWIPALFTLIGGSGGIVYLIDRVRSRPRLVIRDLEEKFAVFDNEREIDKIRFEAENMGEKTTSFFRKVSLNAYTIEAKPVSDTAYRSGISRDRRLNPREPKVFEAHFPETNHMRYSWYLKKYTFRLSHRAKYNLYFLHSVRTPISAFRYWREVLCCKFFGVKGLEAIAKKMNEQRKNKPS